MHLPLAITALLLVALAYASPTINHDLPHELARRANPKSCDDGSQTYNGPYYDGQGTYVTSDKITHPYKFPAIRKCWYDYFVVEAGTELLPWRKSSGDHYCTGSSHCTVQKLTGTQVCQTRSEEVSASVGVEIEGLTLGVSVSFRLDDQKCFSATAITACEWDDVGCHVVWTQQQVFKQVGYRRQRCNWGKGDQTECMADWEVVTPTEFTNYGCGSKCSDTNSCGHTDGSPCS